MPALLLSCLVLLTSARPSYSSCADGAAAIANCASVDAAAPLTQEPADRVRALMARYHAASPSSPSCRRAAEAAVESCGAGSAEVAEAHRRLLRNTRMLSRWRQGLVTEAREVGAGADLAVTCVPTSTETDDHCYVLDRKRPRTVVLKEQRANTNEVPFTVGISGRCTFTVDPFGHLITADHCGETLQYGGWILQTLGDRRVSAEPLARLEVSKVNIGSGKPFEDLSVWQSREAPRGRPFYVLTRDDSRADGCVIEDDFYLACAPRTFASLDGRRAHALGFPFTRYQRRDRAETVVRSDGDLIYDAESNRFLIHAAVSPGSSGGPTYLAAGERLGGLTLDRPLLLGPLSGYAYADRLRAADQATDQSDVLAVVAVYEFGHVRRVLPSF